MKIGEKEKMLKSVQNVGNILKRMEDVIIWHVYVEHIGVGFVEKNRMSQIYINILEHIENRYILCVCNIRYSQIIFMLTFSGDA